MVIDRQTFQVEHSRFNQLGDFLRPGDLLVFNSGRRLRVLKHQWSQYAGSFSQTSPMIPWLALLLCQQGEPLPGCRAGCRFISVRS